MTLQLSIMFVCLISIQYVCYASELDNRFRILGKDVLFFHFCGRFEIQLSAEL